MVCGLGERAERVGSCAVQLRASDGSRQLSKSSFSLLQNQAKHGKRRIVTGNQNASVKD